MKVNEQSIDHECYYMISLDYGMLLILRHDFTFEIYTSSFELLQKFNYNITSARKIGDFVYLGCQDKSFKIFDI